MPSIRPITVYGEPVLHERAAEVEVIDDEIRTLIEDMYVTQEAARGVGLAAPQVGVGLRIFTWTFHDTGDAPNVGHVINPVLTYLSKASQEEPDRHEDSEGCLSVPGLSYPLKRSDHVRLTGQTVDGEPIDFEARGWFARIMQHEYDHLNGTLYVNRLGDRWARKWKRTQRAEKMNVPGVTWLPGEDRDPFGHDDVDADEVTGQAD
ncbi:peptide deformylase [Micrococcus sp. FDAARGOS_333]|uniref:peptide deformylase n=1 Tax=Micrococcus sp. FDAARGOS_333 TaxID=1930558 RepID=UPI000B4E425E|nr:peptide deformylase [Micrococcus sp. FDAARGOS_333]PNL17861.1 peptide deformylase [Micrococcus sp. FDAARGOS_333]